MPATVEVASEYRYRAPVTSHLSHAIAISQSGESLDTLMALRHAQEQGLSTIGLLNVDHSTIAREADFVLPTRAGPEIGGFNQGIYRAACRDVVSCDCRKGKRHHLGR